MKKEILSYEQYKKEYEESVKNPKLFWEGKANNFKWQRKWDSVLDWNFLKAEISWFKGARLNITENCLDRHLEKYGGKTAIKWIANNPNEDSKCFSYIDRSGSVRHDCRIITIRIAKSTSTLLPTTIIKTEIYP